MTGIIIGLTVCLIFYSIWRVKEANRR